MLNPHARLTYVSIGKEWMHRDWLFGILRSRGLGNKMTLETLPFEAAANQMHEFINSDKSLSQLFGDLVVVEADTLPEEVDSESFQATRPGMTATQPLELGCAIAFSTRNVAVLFLVLDGTQPTAIPFTMLVPGDPNALAKLTEAYHRVRLGLSSLRPRQPYFGITERGSLFSAEFEAGATSNQEIPSLVSLEFPDQDAQLEFVTTCSREGFQEASHAPEASIVARVCRHLASLTNEGRHLRAGIIMVASGCFRERFENRSNPHLPDTEASILKLSTLIPLPRHIQLDMRNAEELVRLCEGLDGVGLVLVADSYGSAFGVISVPGLNRNGGEEFLSVVCALGGLGFFVSGDRTVHIGTRRPFFSLHFDRNRWYKDQNATFRRIARKHRDSICASSSIEVFDRLLELVATLSRRSIGGFLIWGEKRNLEAVRNDATSMREALESIFTGRKLEVFSDDSLLQLFSLDGAQLVDCDGTIRSIGIHLRPGGASADLALTGTKRSTAQLITRANKNIIAITISHDGPVRLWRRGEVIIEAEL